MSVGTTEAFPPLIPLAGYTSYILVSFYHVEQPIHPTGQRKNTTLFPTGQVAQNVTFESWFFQLQKVSHNL